MKKILFIIIAIFAIVGCSKDEEEEEIISISMDSEWLSKDSIHYFGTVRENLQNDYKYILVKRKRNNNQTVWRKEMTQPNPINIEIGYGEQKNVNFDIFNFAFDTDELIFVKWVTSSGVPTYPYRYIGVYSSDGELIKNINLEDAEPSFVRWMDGKTIIPLTKYTIVDNSNYYDRTYNYIILDKKGNIIESKEGVELLGIKDPQYVWNKGYVSYTQSKFMICDLDKGSISFDITNIIADKYPQEINKPKIVIKDASFSNEIATINVDITFYNGERRKEFIKINYITHEVID